MKPNVTQKPQENNVMKAKLGALLTVLFVAAATLSTGAGSEIPKGGKQAVIYNFALKNIDGKEVSLSQYRGKALLLVNVASQCGYTPQYEGLQKIYAKYKDQGLMVLGFPANNFGAQEPGTDQEIKTFCSTRYNVTFPMFSKISVKGPDKHPLYQYLTDAATNPKFGGEIKWNFNKFLIDKQGNIAGRFDSKDAPESETVVTAIEKVLN
jgi:glutathione peroxidase